MLRQAPNIIMIGEIRDMETASIAINASLTGHLVLSTLHTNDAPGAIARLIDIGIKPFLVSSSVRAVLAQRLVRRLCSKCKEPGELTVYEAKSVAHRCQLRSPKAPSKRRTAAKIAAARASRAAGYLRILHDRRRSAPHDHQWRLHDAASRLELASSACAPCERTEFARCLPD